jgi:hypothetical protein
MLLPLAHSSSFSLLIYLPVPFVLEEKKRELARKHCSPPHLYHLAACAGLQGCRGLFRAWLSHNFQIDYFL